MFKRPLFQTLRTRLEEPRRFIQALAGARQTGKTTLVRQVLEALPIPSHYATADEPALKDRHWIEQQWEAGRRAAVRGEGAVLVLDEIQKLGGWSETVKRLWDSDTASRLPLRVVVLGSAPLLVQTGLSESLAGRFEVLRVPHWSYAEMREAFGWSLERFVYHGGYPGAAPLVDEPERWRRYVLDSLIEPTISRDVLLLSRVDKPALLRRLFDLGCAYSAQVLSYTKMLGQLQDAGNTTTLAHYLELLKGACLVEGLDKHAGQKVRRRASSPKLQVHDNALVSAQREPTFDEARNDPAAWGRLVESAVGARLVNACLGTQVAVRWWGAGNAEVDFVLVKGDKAVAIEVKSGRKRDRLPGMEAFSRAFDVHRKLLVGGGGIPLAEFMEIGAEEWF